MTLSQRGERDIGWMPGTSCIAVRDQAGWPWRGWGWRTYQKTLITEVPSLASPVDCIGGCGIQLQHEGGLVGNSHGGRRTWTGQIMRGCADAVRESGFKPHLTCRLVTDLLLAHSCTADPEAQGRRAPCQRDRRRSLQAGRPPSPLRRTSPRAAPRYRHGIFITYCHHRTNLMQHTYLLLI